MNRPASYTSSRIVISVLRCLLLSACTAGALAETALQRPATASDLEPVMLSEFEVRAESDNGYKATNALSGTRFNTSLLDLPAPVEVITSKFIEDVQALDLYDILAYSASVAQETAPGIDDFNAASIAIRGYSSPTIYRNGFASSGIFDTLMIDRVEIIKGPSSVFSGAIQPGGTVNIITKKPAAKPGGSMSVRYGSFNRLRADAAYNGFVNRSGSARFRVVAAYEDFGAPTDFTNRKKHIVGTSLLWNPGRKTAVQFDGQYAHQIQHPGARVPFLNSAGTGYVVTRPTFNRQGPEAVSDVEQLFTTTDITHVFNDTWSLKATMLYTYQSLSPRRQQTASTKVTVNSKTGIRTVASSAQYEPNADSFNILPQAYLLGRFHYASIEHRLILGADYAFIDQRNDIYVTNPGALSPMDIDHTASYRLGDFPANYRPSNFRRIRSTQTGASMNNVFSLLHGRLTALMGFRYLKADTAQKNVLAAGTKTSDDSATAQSYGLSWHVLPKLSAFASYSESFNPQLLNFDFAGNLLPPILGKGYDYGVKFDLIDARLSGSVAGFHITRSNALTPDPLHPGFNIAEGESVSDGTEVSLVMRPTDSWQIVASYANINARITKSTRATDIGLRSSNVPKHQGSMWNKYAIREGLLKGVSAGVGVIRVATRRGNSALADLPALELPQYTRVDANLTYERRIGRNVWSFTFLVDNLTDKEYLPSFYGYADPRSYVGKITFRF